MKDLSFSDLYSMYLFVSGDANFKGFGGTSPEAKKIIREKQKEIEEELYQRVYGFNPFVKHRKEAVFLGIKPEDIDLDRVLVVRHPVEEPKDEQPETFVVAGQETEE